MEERFSDRASLYKALVNAQVSQDAAQKIAAISQDSLRLVPTTNSNTKRTGATKFGGLPDLPPDLHWPIRPPLEEESTKLGFFGRLWAKLPKTKQAKKFSDYRQTSQPMNFLGQVNLSDLALPKTDGFGLPNEGILYFFYDDLMQGWGFDPKDATGFKVLFAGSPTQLTQAKRPQMLADVPIYSEVLLDAEIGFDLCTEGIHLGALNLQEQDAKAYSKFLENWYEKRAEQSLQHKMRGCPYLIQNPMEEECALVTSGISCGNSKEYNSEAAKRILSEPNDWVLLMQIDSDQAVNFSWGDSGILYFWIKRSDLEQKRFDNTWLVLQCH